MSILENNLDPLPPHFSKNLSNLVASMMLKSREQRPSAKQICDLDMVQRVIQRKYGIGLK